MTHDHTSLGLSQHTVTFLISIPSCAVEFSQLTFSLLPFLFDACLISTYENVVIRTSTHEPRKIVCVSKLIMSWIWLFPSRRKLVACTHRTREAWLCPQNNGNIPTSRSIIGPQKLSHIQQTVTINTVRRFTRIPACDLCTT